MLLLDLADVPLHVAKLFKYVADARKNELKKMSRNGSSNDDKKSAWRKSDGREEMSVYGDGLLVCSW